MEGQRNTSEIKEGAHLLLSVAFRTRADTIPEYLVTGVQSVLGHPLLEFFNRLSKHPAQVCNCAAAHE